ncbi:hypothetical protein TorRG33x02_295640 [Trema orientale]|uniref:Uncharacterized protein n=1 Tax=Trema orientale TaxID=63057 RepID=A0A2P5C6Z3_TREOI|nr:hypothetical protein TorRG33x02_295640 [Trema orientale]
MDPKKHHFKGLLASSTLASVVWHPYLASNPLLRRHGVPRPVHPEADNMIPEVKESLIVIREALIPQLPSSSTAPPRGVVLGVPPVGDNPRVEGRPVVPELLAASTPRVSPFRIMPPLQPRPGESSRAQGPPLTSVSTEALYGEEVPASASQESPTLPPASAFAEYELFRARVIKELQRLAQLSESLDS